MLDSLGNTLTEKEYVSSSIKGPLDKKNSWKMVEKHLSFIRSWKKIRVI